MWKVEGLGIFFGKIYILGEEFYIMEFLKKEGGKEHYHMRRDITKNEIAKRLFDLAVVFYLLSEFKSKYYRIIFPMTP